LAFGVSVAVHAATFVAWTDSPSGASAVTAAVDDTVRIDVLTDPETPETSSVDAPPATPPVAPGRAGLRASGRSSVATVRDEHPRLAHALAAAAPSRGTNDDLPRFSLGIGAATAPSSGVAAASTTSPAHEGTASLIAAPDSVDVRARLERGIPPAYPPRARAAGVEGDVVLDIVVDPAGAVESARVVQGVGFGLDEAALRAVSDFRFAPASRKGQPVRVRMLWPMRFRLD
jgi:protein TonB